MTDKVQSAVEALDSIGNDRAALREVADRLAKLLGINLDEQRVVVGPPATTGPAEPEKTEFDVLLTSVGLQGHEKIEVIKAVREVTGLGLKEAKDFVEKTTERVVKSGVDKEAAKAVKERLEKAGATVLIK